MEEQGTNVHNWSDGWRVSKFGQNQAVFLHRALLASGWDNCSACETILDVRGQFACSELSHKMPVATPILETTKRLPHVSKCPLGSPWLRTTRADESWKSGGDLAQTKESESEVIQSCSTLCDPMDCSLPGFSFHWILQVRILVWVTISFSRGSS